MRGQSSQGMSSNLCSEGEVILMTHYSFHWTLIIPLVLDHLAQRSSQRKETVFLATSAGRGRIAQVQERELDCTSW
jgi:hypothetical protein